jgi:NAD(P)-dependent dehydrogenase (short-subunit alcohol dehydrogenase family)
VRIRGKVGLVTGAGAGIGRAIALALGREGSAVLVNDVDALSGKRTVREIESVGGRGTFIRADVGKEVELRSMFQFASRTFGGLDILVNNAGFYLRPPFFPAAKPKRWNRVIDIYLRSVMLATQLGIEAMRRRESGAIVNIASMAGIGSSAHELPEYAASKAAVIRFTCCLAPLTEEQRIRVNCICPGWTATKAGLRSLAETKPKERASVPPLIKPEDIAKAAMRLIRDEGLAGRVMLCDQGRRWRLLPQT